jgi:hypothetical protein
MAIQFLNTVAVDTNVLYVDTTNNRVGVGTTNPLRLFHIDSGQNNTAWFRLQGGGGFGRYTDIYNNDDDFLIRADATGGASSIGTINFAIGSDDGVQIGGSGQVTFWQYGSGTFTGTAAKNLAVDSSGNIIETTPVTSNTYDLSGYGTNNGTAGVQLVGSDSSTDQVAITGAGTTSVTRSGSTITVTSNDQYTGTVTGSGTASVTGGQIPYWNSTTNITGTSQLNYSSLAGTGVVGIGNSSTSFIGSRLVVGSGSGSSLMTLYSGSNNTSTIAFANGTSGNAQYRGQVRYNQQNDNLEFLTNGETFSRVYVDSASDLNLVERTLNFRNSFPYAVGAYVDLPTNNQLSIGTNGSERMRITSTGNVGIGTTNPAELLTVSASDDVSIRINSTKNGTWTGGQKLGALEFFGNDGSGEGAGLKGYVNLLSKNQYGAGFDMTFGTTDGTNGISERMRISHNGNVGIGANIPNEKLDVRGKVYIESQGVDWNEATPGLARGAMHFDPVGNGSNNTGNAITFGASDASAGTNAHAGIYTRSDGTYGTKMYFATTDQYATGSKTRMMIDYNGNVGIGTASPIEKLEVVGNAILDNSNAKLKIKAGGTGTVGSIDFTFNTDSTQYGLIDLNYNSRATQGFRIKSLYPLTLDAVTNQKFLISGSQKMIIDSSGDVGIGTTNPGFKLEVNGTTKSLHLLNGISNSLRSCFYTPENIFMSGASNNVGGVHNGAIGYANSIPCTDEPWLNLGGNFIAGKSNTITGNYSHANAVFGQNNTLANQSLQESEAGSLMSGDGNALFGTNGFSWGYQTYSFGDSSLAGGYQSVNFGGTGSISIGLGCTASTGGQQYAFGKGTTTPTTPTAAEIENQFVVGRFNRYATNIGHLFAVGNGQTDFARNTALAVIGEGSYTNGQLSLNDYNGYSSSTYNSRLHVSGNATKTSGSSWISVSDERLKSNIQVYKKGLSEILQITPKTFEFNGKAGTQAGQSQVGIIAQEIKDVLPESINTFNKKLEETDETETELYDFNQDPLVYTLLNAVKELSARIHTLENKIQTLEGN